MVLFLFQNPPVTFKASLTLARPVQQELGRKPVTQLEGYVRSHASHAVHLASTCPVVL